jgi:small subunit ribosomal protein S1
MESPWAKAASNYAIGSIVRGQVSKITDFGAFVRLEPGVEGLVHISELAHRRVNRVNEVLQEGNDVEAKVLSVDPGNQRISLSIKATQARPESERRQRDSQPEPEVAVAPKKQNKNLRGGVGKPTGGEAFGLRW